jgi:hypothetical protein
MTSSLRHGDNERSAPANPDSPVASVASQPARSTTGLQTVHQSRLRSRLRIAARLRAAARFRINSPALLGLIALVMYLAAWLFTEARPLIFHPELPQLFQLSMDPNFYTWALSWWPYAITHGLHVLHPTLIGAPHGYDLAWITSVPPLALLAWPLTSHAGAVVTFNLLTAVALPLSAWAAFVLCRRLTGQFWPALAGGVVYGFSAYQADHNAAGQLNLTYSLLLPLMAYLLVVWWPGGLGRWAFTGLLALAIVFQFYLFLETFADMTGVGLLALAAGYALAGPDHRASVARLSRLVGLAYLIALVFAGPFLWYALHHVPKGFLRSPNVGALDLSSLVLERPDSTVRWFASLVTDHATRASLGAYVGIPLLVLAVALLVFAWKRRLVRFLFVMLVLVIVVSVGPTLTIGNQTVATLPWHRLWYLSVLRSAYPVRLMVFAYLALAIMLAVWLAGPWPAPARFRQARQWWLLTGARWLLALLALAAVVMDLPEVSEQPWPSPAFISSGQYTQYLHPGETVIVQSSRGNAGLLWQAQTGFYFKLAGGYVNAALAHYHVAVPLALAAVSHSGPTPQNLRALRKFLIKAKVGAIIIEEASPYYPIAEDAALHWPRLLNHIGLTNVQVGGVFLYRPGKRDWHMHLPIHH